MAECIKVINNVNSLIIKYENCDLEEVVNFIFAYVIKTRCEMMIINNINKEIIMNGTECSMAMEKAKQEHAILMKTIPTIAVCIVVVVACAIITKLCKDPVTEFIRRRRERREEAEETETDRMETPLIEVDISGEECNICREDRIIIKLECHEEHKVCINCVRRINECPYCRERINKITIRNKIIEIGMREENEERGNIILKSVGFNDQEIRLLRIA